MPSHVVPLCCPAASPSVQLWRLGRLSWARWRSRRCGPLLATTAPSAPRVCRRKGGGYAYAQPDAGRGRVHTPCAWLLAVQRACSLARLQSVYRTHRIRGCRTRGTSLPPASHKRSHHTHRCGAVPCAEASPSVCLHIACHDERERSKEGKGGACGPGGGEGWVRSWAGPAARCSCQSKRERACASCRPSVLPSSPAGATIAPKEDRIRWRCRVGERRPLILPARHANRTCSGHDDRVVGRVVVLHVHQLGLVDLVAKQLVGGESRARAWGHAAPQL